jgi:steroid 5-alpha reductase family enzyme
LQWEVIRTGGLIKVLANPLAWTLFNFGFVSIYQNLLLLLIVAPSFVAYTMATSENCIITYARDLNILDVIATLTFLACVLIESVADNQQFAFQTEKYRLRNTGNAELSVGDYADGFCQSGIFRIVRKPNYAAEQMIWVSFFLFSIAAQKEVASIWNWSAIGSVLLVLLFQGSGWFTEKITMAKYPSYKDYVKRVPLYIPSMLDNWLKLKQE